MSITAAILVVTILGLLGAVVLVVASQFLKVEVDERIELVKEVLPGVNCGACGYAGCADYAEAVVQGEKPTLCVPGGAACAKDIATIMGGKAGKVEVRKAVVACMGTNQNVTERYEYGGIATCSAAAALHGGQSSCPYGCLGYGDCATACPYNAIVVKDGVASVLRDVCTGCGACKAACPKNIIWVREENDKPVVLCCNTQKGAFVVKECKVGCIACKKCEKICPADAIHVEDNIARIQLDKCTNCGKCIEVCPVHCIGRQPHVG